MLGNEKYPKKNKQNTELKNNEDKNDIIEEVTGKIEEEKQ